MADFARQLFENRDFILKVNKLLNLIQQPIKAVLRVPTGAPIKCWGMVSSGEELWHWTPITPVLKGPCPVESARSCLTYYVGKQACYLGVQPDGGWRWLSELCSLSGRFWAGITLKSSVEINFQIWPAAPTLGMGTAPWALSLKTLKL